MAIIIKHACVVNEGQRGSQDIKIVGKRIVQIATDITAKVNDQVIDANGLLLLPGMIDDQVHFREPGLTHKGTIASESAAARKKADLASRFSSKATVTKPKKQN